MLVAAGFVVLITALTSPRIDVSKGELGPATLVLAFRMRASAERIDLPNWAVAHMLACLMTFGTDKLDFTNSPYLDS